MKINTKIMILVAVSMLFISLVIGLMSRWGIKRTGKIALSHMGEIGDGIIEMIGLTQKEQNKTCRYPRASPWPYLINSSFA